MVVFVRAYEGLIFTPGQFLVFDYHGQNLKATVKGVMNLSLNGDGSKGGRIGILTRESEVNFLKDPASAIKIKSSAKKYVLAGAGPRTDDTGHRRTRSSRPTLSSRTWASEDSTRSSLPSSVARSRLASSHPASSRSLASSTSRVRPPSASRRADVRRYPPVRSARDGQDPHGASDRQNA